MTDLIPTSALDGAVARFGALELAERPEVALASLALRRSVAPPAPFGLTLPGPGDWAGEGGTWAVWAGPGQWLIGAEGRAAEDFAATVKAEAPGCSVTEQSDGWVAVGIVSQDGAGPMAALLERLVNLPPEALTPGRATRTLLHHQSAFVLRRAEDRLLVLGARSSAGSLWHHLGQVAGRL